MGKHLFDSMSFRRLKSIDLLSTVSLYPFKTFLTNLIETSGTVLCHNGKFRRGCEFTKTFLSNENKRTNHTKRSISEENQLPLLRLQYPPSTVPRRILCFHRAQISILEGGNEETASWSIISSYRNRYFYRTSQPDHPDVVPSRVHSIRVSLQLQLIWQSIDIQFYSTLPSPALPSSLHSWTECTDRSKIL